MIRTVTHIGTVNACGGASKVGARLAEAQRARGILSREVVGRLCSPPNELVQSFEILPFQDAHEFRRLGLQDYEFQGSHALYHHDWIRASDVLHLHNLHGGYFNPYSLLPLSQAKPLVWTLHDMHSFTGHCAHSMNCTRWKQGCGECPDLTIYPNIQQDMSAFLWEQKRKIYTHTPLAIVTPSNWLRAKVDESILLAHPKTSVHTIHNFVDTRVFKPFDDTTQIRRALSIPESAFVIGVVAHSGVHANRWKGGMYADEIIRGLAQEFSNIYFLNIGTDAGSAYSGFANMINVPYVDSEEILAQFYSCLDVFLFTSIAENCLLVVLEALACGVPVVSFAVGGVPELVRHNQDGIVVPERDSASAREALRTLIQNKVREREMRICARKRAVESFSLEKVSDEYLHVYEAAYENFHSSLHIEIPEDFLQSLPEFIRTEYFTNALKNISQAKVQTQKSEQANPNHAVLLASEHQIRDELASFSYSRYSHIRHFKPFGVRTYFDANTCDLKVYQDLLMYWVLTRYLPKE